MIAAQPQWISTTPSELTALYVPGGRFRFYRNGLALHVVRVIAASSAPFYPQAQQTCPLVQFFGCRRRQDTQHVKNFI
jgi:hypothetical protein